MKEKSFIAKVNKQGGSSVITIPRRIIKEEVIQTDDLIRVSVSKEIRNGDDFYVTCTKCSTAILVKKGEEIIDCPSCDETELKVNLMEKYYGEIY